ncbi:hypothetical protein H6G00_08310 [Leptolyngbya sp. FACHB-541]|nr:hypothetical protein [Cyanobacteria bacterium FACHB-471]MBD1996620.1 hypothetical protein [Leptolyngbya sp. FACHB-541]
MIVQIVIAILCAGIATILIPRRIPGKLIGMIVIGLTGVWLGEWGTGLLRQRYAINYSFLNWSIEGVPIVPAIIGSAVILYLVTSFLKWGRYYK